MEHNYCFETPSLYCSIVEELHTMLGLGLLDFRDSDGYTLSINMNITCLWLSLMIWPRNNRRIDAFTQVFSDKIMSARYITQFTSHSYPRESERERTVIVQDVAIIIILCITKQRSCDSCTVVPYLRAIGLHMHWNLNTKCGHAVVHWKKHWGCFSQAWLSQLQFRAMWAIMSTKMYIKSSSK